MSYYIAGAVVVSSYVGSRSASQAASQQAGAVNEGTRLASEAQLEGQRMSIEEQRRQFDLTRGDTTTARQTGVGALNYLNQALLPEGYRSYTDPNADPNLTPETLSIQQASETRGGAGGIKNIIAGLPFAQKPTRPGGTYGEPARTPP